MEHCDGEQILQNNYSHEFWRKRRRWGLEDVPVQFSSMKRKDFDTLDFFIDFEARFKVLMSMSHQMKDYYDWAEGIFGGCETILTGELKSEKIPTVLKARGSEYFTL